MRAFLGWEVGFLAHFHETDCSAAIYRAPFALGMIDPLPVGTWQAHQGPACPLECIFDKNICAKL